MTIIRPITTVKKEIRILGIDACNSEQFVGVIVRGGTFLDGVVTFRPQTRKYIGHEISRIPYFPELRGIMLHDPKHRLDPDSIENDTGLPVMVVGTSSRITSDMLLVRTHKGSLLVRTKIPTSTLNKIVDLTWSFGRLPEPLRLSHLFSMQI